MSRILWHSAAAWAPSGYGQQTATFAPRIRDAGHDVALSAWYGLNGAALEWEGMTVYPGDQKWGNTILLDWAKRHDAELVIALMDAWVLNPELGRRLNLAIWVPVDHAPAPPKVAEFFRRSGARPVAMSRFGEKMLQDEGLDPLYVPHGVDTNIYRPGDRDRVRKLFQLEDAFVVGMVASNSGGMPPASAVPRKAFPQAFMAFSELYHRHDNARLYLHTEMTGRPGLEHGLDLQKLLERFEIPDEAVTITSPAMLEAGISQSEMAALYSTFDVLLSPSYGEGFGIPIIEAQACGTPVIVTDWTAMPELCGAGWKVGGEPFYDCVQDAFYLSPSVGEIVAALEDAYQNAGGLREQARNFALNYDADRVMQEHWLPTLEALLAPREVPPLALVKPNREMRRKAAKAKAA